jgi:hypothetical protein
MFSYGKRKKADNPRNKRILYNASIDGLEKSPIMP